MKLKKYWLAVGVILALASVSLGVWSIRHGTTLWGVDDKSTASLLEEGLGPQTIRVLSHTELPWEQPDLTLRWADPWSPGSPDPLVRTISGPLPRGLVAFEVLGLVSFDVQLAATDYRQWLIDLDRKAPGQVPLGVSGKSDAEFLSTFFWFADGVLGPDRLQSTFTVIQANPGSSLASSGLLAPDHPWVPVVNEIRRWMLQGRLAPNWWDYSGTDVLMALGDKKFRWALVWSKDSYDRAMATGKQATLETPPAWPNRRSSTLHGRWLLGEPSPAWGDLRLAVNDLKKLATSAVAERWLDRHGILLADADVPAVNQVSKRLVQGLFSAGSLVTPPSEKTDLSAWKPLVEALRTALR